MAILINENQRNNTGWEKRSIFIYDDDTTHYSQIMYTHFDIKSWATYTLETFYSEHSTGPKETTFIIAQRFSELVNGWRRGSEFSLFCCELSLSKSTRGLTGAAFYAI
jgi:hypothetical protein